MRRRELIPQKITFAIEGPAKTTQTASGDILIETTSGTIKISKPLNYQRNADGSQTPVEGSFKLASDGTVQAGVPTRDVVIKLASYDRSRSLYIDPVVIPYSTYFGGHAQSVGPVNLEQFGSIVGKANLKVADQALDLALDSSSPPKAYITGVAYSTDLPTKSAFQTTLNGHNAIPNQNPNVLIAKFDTSQNGGNSLVYSTYLGSAGDTKFGDRGNGDGDIGFGLAVDGNGDAYVVGQTYSGNPLDSPASPDFPGVGSC